MYYMLDKNYFLNRETVSLECSLTPPFLLHCVVVGTVPSISHMRGRCCYMPTLGAFSFGM